MINKNYKILINYLNYNNIYIDNEEFRLQLEGHPNFPSLLSYSDTLKFFNIENASYKIRNEEINLLPEKFIALSNGEFTLIENKKSNTFFSDWDNIVLVINNVQSDLKNKIKLSPVRVFSIILFLFMILLCKIDTSYLVLKIVFFISAISGLFLAIEAYKKTHGKGTIIPIGVCQNKILKTDCDFVFNAKRWDFFKYVDLSEISIIFFTSQIFCFFLLSFLCQIETLFTIYKYGLLLFIPVSFLSLYYQFFVVKKFCPICIIIISCVFIQLSSLYFLYINKNIDIIAILFYCLGLVFTITILYFLKIKFKFFQKLENENKNYLKFRKNFTFFKNNLAIQKELLNKDHSNAFKFGNRNSNINFTIITNPYCKHCKLFYPYFMQIIKHLSDKLCINIILDADLKKHSNETNQAYIELAQIYNNAENKNEFLIALSEWYILHNAIDKKENWYVKYSKYFENEDQAVSILKYQRIWLNENEIYYTPSIFINNLEYPTEYERSDIEYFISEIIDDNGNF